MTPQQVLVAVLALSALFASLVGRISLDVIGIGLLVILVAAGIVDETTALSGFAHPTVLVLAGLYVIGEGLTRTGALAFLARALARVSGRSTWSLQLCLCYAAALVSAFVSDTAVVIVFLPIAITIAQERNVAIAHLLLPIAYSALLGGTLTLVGSTINLIASGVAENFGQESIGFFEMTPYALPLVILGVPFVVWATRRFIKVEHDREPTVTPQERQYLARFLVRPTARGRRHDPTALLCEVEQASVARAGRSLPPSAWNDLRSGDRVWVRGSVAEIMRLRTILESSEGRVRREAPEQFYFEVAVTPHSRFVGRPLGDLPLERDYGVSFVARQALPNARSTHGILRRGALLLVCGDRATQERMRASSDFLIVDAPRPSIQNDRRRWRALLVLAFVVAGFVLVPTLGLRQILPLPLVSLLGALAMVASGCVSAREAYGRIDTCLLIFIVGALALGRAVESTHLSDLCASALVAPLLAHGPVAVLIALLAVGTLLNQFTSPYAVAALLMPIGLAMARELGVEPRPFLLAVTFAGSNAFATPLGHQVNLMVMGPGGYRVVDFLKVGLPTCCLYGFLISLGLAVAM